MTHEEFMTALLRPSFVWRAAAAVLVGDRGDGPGIHRARKGAPKRMENAQAEIDDLVLARADEIFRERGLLLADRSTAVRMYEEHVKQVVSKRLDRHYTDDERLLIVTGFFDGWNTKARQD